MYSCAFGKKYKTNANIERDQTRDAIKKETIRYFFEIVSLSSILKFLANLTVDLIKKYSGIIIRKRIGINNNKNIKIVLNLNALKPTINCDSSQMANTILNLIINANDAMPDGGTITISTANNIIENAEKKGTLKIPRKLN